MTDDDLRSSFRQARNDANSAFAEATPEQIGKAFKELAIRLAYFYQRYDEIPQGEFLKLSRALTFGEGDSDVWETCLLAAQIEAFTLRNF